MVFIELYGAIVQHIPQDDSLTLHRLLFTSVALSAEATRRLYYRISFDSTGLADQQERGLSRQRIFNATITQNPHLARLVRSFVLHTGVEFEDKEYWASLAVALRALTQLKALHFSYTYSTEDRVSSILDGCVFELERFAWFISDGPSLLVFLESQPLIKHLSLRWEMNYDDEPQRPSLSPSALPNLRTLQGGQGVMDSILPGRPYVTHLHWVPELDDDPMPDMFRIGSALSSIRVLQYGIYFSAPEFDYVVGYLPNLEVLYWNNGYFVSVSRYSLLLV